MRLFNLPEKYSLKNDAIAGLTIGIVTIPQAMAFALLAGLPPIYGLYGSLIPLIVYAFFASSNFINVGPVSVISIFVFQTITPFESPFTSAYINSAVILGLMIGLIQLLMGFFRLGSYAKYLHKSVISGFIQAAALVIIISQLSPGFGQELPNNGTYFDKVFYLISNISLSHSLTTFLFLSSLLLLLVFATYFPKFPTTIMLLILSGLASFFFDFDAMGVSLIGKVPVGLPVFIIPSLSLENLNLLPGAIGIAFVASIGSIIMGKSLEERQPFPLDINQDLKALGLAKIASAFFGSLVPAGSFNRSILNIKVGAQSQIAGLFAALVIIFTLLFLTPMIYFLPQPIIAAIIVYSVYFLFDFSLIKQLLATNKLDAFYLFFTTIMTLFFGFVYGIFLGVFISLLGNYFRRKTKT
ncbi:SulP family inorganic anion transporter [Flavobacteriaceae bacterium]|nr:SulP family inorganic anion transporter [Flavobacteriaceae bacterium]